ncbi:fungal alpha-L-arabinofuranosidase [Kockovaella imperatae]|uniref:Alpha-L-arabinofuranosidase n=1 Tax=Kockovaella imperatae TaxID=4999 RepID=A0A1Y1UBD9_9TREE|nr:fungal alpha-L-arabinofuranosidase [Kockovaella imperatae]ORX35339.1 fungal alpha-L-arabinofuranosidase [Kockovaella imperatae]
MDLISSALPIRLLHALGLAAVAPGVCDIYASGDTPCVAAHSTTRALYSSYRGPLYQVTRGSDDKTVDITPLKVGGVANSRIQDKFCRATTCEISIIYDQSGNQNHLTRAPGGGADIGEYPGGYDILASAVAAPVTVQGHKVYGVFTPQGAGYRCNTPTNVPVGNEAEGIYAVLDGTHYNGECCYDYGNAETTTNDEGKTTMETIYFGGGNEYVDGHEAGPWVMADLEDGLFGSDIRGKVPAQPPLNHRFVMGIVKGANYNLWTIRAGDASAGSLHTAYSGRRPEGYYPMNKKGAVLLGVGGDNSFRGVGTFYEGALTAGYPRDDIEDRVQANIVSAEYGTISSSTGPEIEIGSRVSFDSGFGFVSHNGPNVTLLGNLSTGSVSKASTFIVREGNGDKTCFSFESVVEPGHYLRQANYTIFVDSPDSTRDSPSKNKFEEDSTFCTEPALDGSDGVSLRSWNFPTRYLRTHGKHNSLHIAQHGGAEDWDSVKNFYDETSWAIVESA